MPSPLNRILLLVLLLGFFISNCSEDTELKPEVTGAFKEGVFIANEGVFRWNNASLSFYNTSNDSLRREVFKSTTGKALGDVAQSIRLFRDSLLFIVVNNSEKIEVMNTRTGQAIATIPGMQSPRYTAQVNDSTIWVTDLYANHLTSINLNSLTNSGQVETGKPTEAIVRYQNKVFVSNWSGDSTVQVIDIENKTVTHTLQVSSEPNSMVLDAKNQLWVLCAGGYNPAEAKTPALYRIDPEQMQIQQTFTFQQEKAYPEKLVANKTGNRLYYLNGDVFAMSINDRKLPEQPHIQAQGRVFYGLYIHPVTGRIWVSDAKDYVQQGTVFIYTAEAALHGQFQAGIIPSAFCAVR